MTIHMDGKSLDLRREQLERLKSLFPEAVSEGRIDFDRLRQTLGDEVIPLGERYVLNWAGKSEAFKAIQTPTTATLKAQKKESVDFDTTQNIFIEGENLEVLKVLQKSYYGKVKMIYIDPPYNTGNDSFIYPDKFAESKEEYLKRIGDKDEEGYLTKEGLFRKNSKENGQFHSNWLSMMYPRLFLARNLLRDDGVIFVSIDDNEVHNLRLMMNEIFGEENFVGALIWKSRHNVDSRNQSGISIDHEYVLAYGHRVRGREIDMTKYSNPDNDLRGPWMSDNMVGLATKEKRPNLHYDLINPETGINYGCPAKGWRYEPSTMSKKIDEKRILWPADPGGRPRHKKFVSELKSKFTGFSSILNAPNTIEGTKEIYSLFGAAVFDFPKPVDLIKSMVEQATDEGDIVLDFFAGACPTAEAVLELNIKDEQERSFICVQLSEKTTDGSEAMKAGFNSIAEIGMERIRKSIDQIKEHIESQPDIFRTKNLDLGFKVFKLEPSNFKVWLTDTIKNEDDLKRQIEAFQDPVKKKSEADAMAWEILIKSGYELTTPLERVEIADAPVYSIANGEVMLALEKISQKTIDAVIAKKPKRVICLDSLFARQTDGGQAGNDQLKTNTALQMKDAGVEFRTI